MEQPIILAVDDAPENIEIIHNILHDVYKVKAALSGEQALKILQKDPKPDMILLDIMMPHMDGYEVCRRIKANPKTAMIPIIFITALEEEEDEQKGLDLGAVDYITKPINPAITKTRIKTHLNLYDQNRHLEKKVQERTQAIHDTRLLIIRQLGRAAEFKDNETGLHVIRMSHYTRLIIESLMEESNSWTDLLFQAAPMHDIGKIGIPDRILLKPGKLDSDEWDVMKKHPLYGAEIIGEHHSPLLQMAREIALYHHEKWDGSGYPYALKGEEIPLCARVIAIADVFDALTTERPYKKAWSFEKAAEYIKAQSGSHFDPELVEHMVQVLPQMYEIQQQFQETVVFH